jgi:hypothetical protein
VVEEEGEEEVVRVVVVVVGGMPEVQGPVEVGLWLPLQEKTDSQVPNTATLEWLV